MITIKKLHPNAKLPTYQTEGSAGADIHALLEHDYVITNGAVAMIPTGLAMAIPQGYEVQIRARSGLGATGIIIPNAPGTIDSDYRGEIKILLQNLSGKDFVITSEMRIAQMVLAPVTQATFDIVDELPETQRGSGGFGSTGL